jgi:hypothetical protein
MQVLTSGRTYLTANPAMPASMWSGFNALPSFFKGVEFVTVIDERLASEYAHKIARMFSIFLGYLGRTKLT